MTPERPLNIVHLVNHVKNSGNGIVNVAIDLAVEQAKLGHRPYVASSGGDNESLLASMGVEHRLIEQRGMRSLQGSLIKLLRLVRDERIDIIHAHMVKSALLARVVSSLTGARLVTSVHNSWQKRAILMGVGHRVIAVSDAVKSEMTRRGIKASKLRTVTNGVIGSERYTVTSNVQIIRLDRPAVLCVAGLYVRKGILDLIDAIEILLGRIPDVKLYIAGEGPDRRTFEERARKSGLDQSIIFLGFQPNVNTYLKQADVFVLASHAEPFGLVLAEARSERVPIVATNVGGIPEALEHGIAGILVPPKDPKALADAIGKVLTDGQFSEGLRNSGQQNLTRFHVRRMAIETLDIYYSALSPP